MVVVIALMFAGCSVQVDVTNRMENSIEFENANGIILERTFKSVGDNVPVGFYIGFDKKSGDADIKVYDPNGKTIYSDAMKAGYVYPNRPADDLPLPNEEQAIERIESLTEEQKESWGFFTFKWLPEVEGEYRFELSAEDLTAAIVYEKLNPSLVNFTGIVEEVEYEIDEVGKNLNLLFQSSDISKGSLFIRIFDPDGNQIRVSELTNEKSSFVYTEPATMTGTYTAYIEAKEATGIVRATIAEEKQIPNTAFLLPILITLLGIIGYILVKKGNRKLIIWGALFWLGAYFIGLIITQFLAPVSGTFWGTYSILNYWTIISIISSLMLGIAPLLVGIVADVKNATPKELIGFGVGFVIAPAIFEGLNGISNINTVGKQILPYGNKIVGTYASIGEAVYQIGVPIITRVCLMTIIFALTMVIIWALRQKTVKINKGLIILAGIAGIVLTNVLFSYINMIVTQTQSVILFSIAYPFGSQITQAIIISIIMIIAAVYIYFKRENINTLADQTCSVTIYDMKK